MSTASLSDDEFVEAFVACRLAPEQFDHTGHLRIALLLLQRHPVDDAVERTCAGIQRLATHLGAPEKYHRTLTETVVRLLDANGGRLVPWQEFLRAKPMFVTDLRALVARHYSAALLNSSQAKHHFVQPDRHPLPST